MTHHRGKLTLVSMVISLLFPAFVLSACADGSNSTSTNPGNLTGNPSSNSSANKVSSQLKLQISLRKAQIESPTPERLAQMQMMGMQVQNVGTQRIYIYLYQPLTPTQVGDLQILGITLFPDSWIPPAGNNSSGFMLADMPVDKLDDLAGRNYIISLDTAEKSSQPQSDLQKGG